MDRAFCEHERCSKIVPERVSQDQRRGPAARKPPLNAFCGTSGIGHLLRCCSARICLGVCLVGVSVKFVSLSFVCSFCLVWFVRFVAPFVRPSGPKRAERAPPSFRPSVRPTVRPSDRPSDRLPSVRPIRSERSEPHRPSVRRRRSRVRAGELPESD